MKFSTLIAYNSKPNFVQQGPFYNIWSHITYIYIKIKLNSKVILLIWKREHILHTEEHMYNTCIPDAGLQSVSLNPTISRNNQNCIIKAWQMLTYKWAVQVHIQSLTKFIITFDGHNQKIKQQMSVQWWVAFIILVISSQVHTGVHITQLLHTHTHTQCVCVCVCCARVSSTCVQWWIQKMIRRFLRYENTKAEGPGQSPRRLRLSSIWHDFHARFSYVWCSFHWLCCVQLARHNIVYDSFKIITSTKWKSIV